MSIKVQELNNPNPLETASYFNKLWFWWLKSLINYGSKNDLEIKDLYNTLPKNRSEKLRNDLERVWEDELKRQKNHESILTKALFRAYKWKFLKYVSLLILSHILQLLEPLLLQLVMSYFHSSTVTTKTDAYIYVTIFIVLMIMQNLLERHGKFELMMIGMQMETAISSLMYKKLIRLSSISVPANTGASIVNLLSNDVSQFGTICFDLPFLLIFPLQLIICTIFICQLIGYPAGLIGITLMILQTLPLQVLMYNVTLKMRSKLSSRSDLRISLLSEIIDGIQAIKMYVWENYFEKLVQIARKKEIQYYLKISYITSIVYTSGNFVQRLCTFISILICTLQGNVIPSDKIIPATQYLSILGGTISRKCFYSVKYIAYSKVAVERIQEFMLRNEKKHDNIKKLDAGDRRSILFRDVKASWDSERIELTVDDVNFEIAVNDLCIIMGSVGSGKSTLLNLILGEIFPISGDVYVQGNLSYASQEPWLFPVSIRENIIFGEKFDDEWYEQVTKACALDEDFNQMPYGDKTLVGDRGITLSGGQRARINMARSIYKKADIYLLDDPLSAVDVRVARVLFENCINGLIKNKTRVLVTNNMQYLNKADKIILIEQGKIKYVGNFTSFYDNKTFQSYLVSLDTSTSKDESKIVDSDEPSEMLSESHDNKPIDDEPEEIGEIIAKGNISGSLYLRYIRASRSYFNLFLFVVFSIMATISIAAFDYYLADSTTMKTLSEFSNSTIPTINVESINWKEIKNSLYILASSVTVIVTSSILKSISFHKLTLNASKNIHNEMFTRTLGTPLRFFETNPSGRILNRFSEDTGSVDDLLPKTAFTAIDLLPSVMGMLLTVLIINVWLALPMIVIGCICYKLSTIYIRIIQGIKRLEGIAKSPVLSFATTSLAGAVTIRSCQVERKVCKDFDSRQDNYMKPYFLNRAVDQAFCFWLEILMIGLLAVVAYSCVIFKSDNEFAAFIGLSLMQILNIKVILTSLLLHSADTMTRMVNVERMFQYTELEQEGEERIQKVCDTWPDAGEIKFHHIYLRYFKDGEAILKDLNFIIEPGTKVGIVGRTGAGKSSLISAIFQLTNIDGSLYIDGVDIKTINLSDLRSKISIIPQEPTLFNATLRDNLDPLNEYDDATIWSALNDVELNRVFTSLDYTIARNGCNLSSGQRQLICLARAIIKKNKILIMDEATSNIDLTTDKFIQKTIRKKFNDCTVLIIAHRLNTVMDSDKILVMDNGRAVEYDNPYLLMKKSDSLFYNLVQKTNRSMSQNLENIAERAYEE